jgi:hypothetical protein
MNNKPAGYMAALLGIQQSQRGTTPPVTPALCEFCDKPYAKCTCGTGRAGEEETQEQPAPMVNESWRDRPPLL